jgi:hypothetical protein
MVALWAGRQQPSQPVGWRPSGPAGQWAGGGEVGVVAHLLFQYCDLEKPSMG